MFKQKVISVVNQIPYGAVAAYSDVAALAGSPGAARVVGQIAKYSSSDAPWHRVVRSDGTLAEGFAWGGAKAQQRLLESEGVAFSPTGAIVGFESLRGVAT
ncbi:TPA: methylated-DNA--[protein]-cysteine S-methyltransferase [Candidatus Saccharibacteria bacterium]|nr:methylated-DNA--[protein]-cysteine S-methyltransferase [Candidatus Saccharibacteria bacterium]HIO87694.1 methylated-DNA--[protein]-cysteine S-methyltransferase [Candidatus Saccharibacteria bacterium]